MDDVAQAIAEVKHPASLGRRCFQLAKWFGRDAEPPISTLLIFGGLPSVNSVQFLH